MDNNFTSKLQQWVYSTNKDYEEGAMLLLKLTGNKIMYRNLMMNPKRNAQFIEYQLQKQLEFRLRQTTHEEVEKMQEKVDRIMEKKAKAEAFKQGKRDDHDELPDEIQACYVENLSILQKMRQLHLKLRSLTLTDSPCPDSERYPFLKELITLDKKMHKNWQIYDRYTGKDGEKQLDENAREMSIRALRSLNLCKKRYMNNPSEELKEKMQDWYDKIINPKQKLTDELIELGIIDKQ